MPCDSSIARRLWQRLEPVHLVTYFSPEPLAALKQAGYRGFWMGYFAGRAAPLGAVGAEMVTALFYNFSYPHVSRAIPDAWTFALPDVALDARLNGSVAALRRAFDTAGESASVARAAELARAAADVAPLEGRTLFAANRALPWPDEPVGDLWHAATLLREHRGDGHVAALAAAGISGREANVLQAAAGIVAKDMFFVSRHYDNAEWAAVSTALAGRGLIDGDGTLTADGKAVKADIEDRTDRMAATAYDVLDDSEVDEILEALTPLSRAVVATGEIPAAMPIGLTFDE